MTKRALCIGTNYVGTSNELAGCVNDAMDWTSALTERGYAVTMLLDSGAKRAAILGGIRALVDSAKSGDRIVITFSGHGTWVPDRDGDEADRRDEAICPDDLRSAGVITDDQLYEVFSPAKPGARLIFIADSCYSGTIQRFAPQLAVSRLAPSLARFLPPADWADEDMLDQPVWRAAEAAGPKGKPRRSALALAACSDAQVAYDAWFDGRANGAFTYAALKALRALPEGGSYRAWHAGIRKLLPSVDYPQSPQLDGTSTQKRWQALV